MSTMNSSNVIRVSFSTPQERQAAALEPLLRGFATSRRFLNDVMWMKENGELLNVLETSGTEVPHRFLTPHANFYREIDQRLAFFPQYYRFLLSIALDLEDLGWNGHKAEAMGAWILDNGLVEAETSDIQRAEARRLLSRRGLGVGHFDDGLDHRLIRFVEDPSRFALPNKKAAYELTHIVFYLSEYGRKDPNLSQSARKALENVGIWAFLDGNIDLLSEICIAIRFAKYNPAVNWEKWIAQEMSNMTVKTAPNVPHADAYHTVFMAAWLGNISGQSGLSQLPVQNADLSAGALTFELGTTRRGALRELSQSLFAMGSGRSSDWGAMRARVVDGLSPEAHDWVTRTEETTSDFAEFFESFARTSMVATS
ncbi:MAG: hypothetical protein MK098_10300 [Marinovum sp.]|nr:hypothetical protein [Marinovum sp.]